MLSRGNGKQDPQVVSQDPQSQDPQVVSQSHGQSYFGSEYYQQLTVNEDEHNVHRRSAACSSASTGARAPTVTGIGLATTSCNVDQKVDQS